MTRRQRVVLAVALLTALLGVPLSGAAATIDAHAWWWRAQTGLLVPAPAPPTVPQDGLSVGNGPDDPLAVSAVRFLLEDGEVDPVLVLTVANGDGGTSGDIVACPTEVRWQPTQAGAWAERPPSDCDGAVAGVLSDDGTEWSWELTPLVVDGRINVVLQPASEAGPFQYAFDAPTDASLRTRREAGPSDGFTPPPVITPTEPGSGESAAPPPVTVPPIRSDSGPAPTTETPPVVAGPDTGQPPVAAPQPGSTAAPVATRDARPYGWFLLALTLATAGLVRAESVDGPRRLGPLADGPEPTTHDIDARGLGRFARPRTGPPPRIV